MTAIFASLSSGDWRDRWVLGYPILSDRPFFREPRQPRNYKLSFPSIYDTKGQRHDKGILCLFFPEELTYISL